MAYLWRFRGRYDIDTVGYGEPEQRFGDILILLDVIEHELRQVLQAVDQHDPQESTRAWLDFELDLLDVFITAMGEKTQDHAPTLGLGACTLDREGILDPAFARKEKYVFAPFVKKSFGSGLR